MSDEERLSRLADLGDVEAARELRIVRSRRGHRAYVYAKIVREDRSVLFMGMDVMAIDGVLHRMVSRASESSLSLSHSQCMCAGHPRSEDCHTCGSILSALVQAHKLTRYRMKCGLESVVASGAVEDRYHSICSGCITPPCQDCLDSGMGALYVKP